MTENKRWPSLEGWDATRDTLHAYAQVAGAPPRVLAEPHPKWWHISLNVGPEGLLSGNMSHEALGDRDLQMHLNLRKHALELLLDDRVEKSFDLRVGMTATEMGRDLQAALADIGAEVELPRDKFADDDPRHYDIEVAEKYLAAVRAVNDVMDRLRAGLDGDRSPVQLWPHHFDLAFEWFGTKTVTYEENGEQNELPAQLNFGFAPGDRSHREPYFYSNPWPFDEQLTEESLPHGARWFTEGFEGTLLPYARLAGDADAAQKLLAYYRKVFEVARPSLME